MSEKVLFNIIIPLFWSISSLAQVPKLTHIHPNAGMNEQSITAHIYGDNFVSISSVRLEKPGYPYIFGDSINVKSENYLECTFNFTGNLTGLYDLKVTNAYGSGKLSSCFTVYSRTHTPYMWRKVEIGETDGVDYKVTLGDGNNDGEMEVYSASGDGNIYQFMWDGINWVKNTVGSGRDDMYKVAVGDGNNDGELEVYGASLDSTIYQFKWDGVNWLETTVGIAGIMEGVAVGDGNDDGELEVYAACRDDSIYQFKWNGMNWIRTIVGFSGNSMSAVVVGDGNNDREIEVYSCSWNTNVFQFKWDGASWERSRIPSTGTKYDVALGDGRNEGKNSVYSASGNSNIYEFRWVGAGGWDIRPIGSGGPIMRGVAVGDGNGDGQNEVYGSNIDSKIYQFKWDGNNWLNSSIGSGAGTMFGVAVGDGNNDGEIEVYGASQSENIIQFKAVPAPIIVVSDTFYNYGSTFIGSSIDWDSLIIKNTGIGKLSLDSITSDTADFIVINPLFPDTIPTDDSILVKVRFSPSFHDTISGSLNIYSNDPNDSIIELTLKGIGLESSPPEPFSLISPQDSVMIAYSRPSFIWEASYDSISGLMNYEVYIKDSLRTTCRDTLWASDYNLSEGYNEWYVIAYDSLGNYKQSNEIWNVYIDTTAPVIDSTTIVQDTSYMGPFPVYTKVIDISEVDTVLLCFKRFEDLLWVSIEMADSGNGWYYEEIPQVFIADDTVKYYICAKDKLKNDSTDPLGAPSNHYWFIANWSGIEEDEKPLKFSFSVNSLTNERTVFKISLPEKGRISLRIFDIMGRVVSNPTLGDYSTGYYDITFKPENSGIYFYLFKSPYGDRRGKIIVF